MIGTIRALKETYGFVDEPTSGKSYFFHENETRNFRKLMIGDKISFNLGEGKKGAGDVVAIDVERKEKGIEEILEEEAGEEAKEE